MPYPESMTASNPKYHSLNTKTNQYANESILNNPNLVPPNHQVMRLNALNAPGFNGNPPVEVAQPASWWESFKQGLGEAAGDKDSIGFLGGAGKLASAGLQGWLGYQDLQLGKQQLAHTTGLDKINLDNAQKTANLNMNERHRNQLLNADPDTLKTLRDQATFEREENLKRSL